MSEQIEYPCPECGHDGPHTVVEQDPLTVECAGCYCEFPAEAPEAQQ